MSGCDNLNKFTKVKYYSFIVEDIMFGQYPFETLDVITTDAGIFYPIRVFNLFQKVGTTTTTNQNSLTSFISY